MVKYTVIHIFTVDYISAGDIEKYAYCPLSWWLSRGEKHTESKGVIEHEKISKLAISEINEQKKAGEFERAVLYFASGASVVAVVGISMLYSSYTLAITFHTIAVFWLLAALYLLWKSGRYIMRWRENYRKLILVLPLIATTFSILALSFLMAPNYMLGYTLEIASLVWLIGATFFYYMSLKSELRYSKIRKELHLPDGEIIYVDDMKSAPLLKSKKYGIWGRPDMLLKLDGGYVPVELKTGRVPRGPYFSHIMQLTAYMLLVEENYQTPQYGLLMYGPQIYRIEYEEDLKQLLLSKIKEMRRAMQTGEVHRNHNRPGKCKHCSRREICPERLA